MEIQVVKPVGQELVSSDLMARAREYAQASKASSTIRCYHRVWQRFCKWATARGLTPLPATPETIVAYIADMAEKIKPNSIKQHLAAVAQAHRIAGYAPNTNSEMVRLTMRGVCRLKGLPSQPRKALRVAHIKAIVQAMPDNLAGARDKAVILLGMFSGLRRSEIVALNVDDLFWEPEGIVLTIKKSKTDKDGRGRQIVIPRAKFENTCPVRSLKKWMDAAGITTGPLFIRLDKAGKLQRLTDQSIALIIKKAADRAGLDANMFSGHSLRRGFATECARSGASEIDIGRVTGHRSLVILRGYIEEGTAFGASPAKLLDL